MNRRYWRGPFGDLVPLIAYLNGSTQISDGHQAAEPELAAPVAAGRVITESATSAEVHAVNLPAATAGDLQLLAVNGAATLAYGIADPAGWTQVYDEENGFLRGALFARFAPATAGATTVNVTLTGGGQRLTAVAWTITGAADDLLENILAASAVASANNLAPDPNAVTIPWGADVPSLVLAIAHSAAGNEAEYPAGYSDGLTAYTGVSNAFHARTSAAERVVSAASENPGAFSIDTSTNRLWTAWAVAIKGGPA